MSGVSPLRRRRHRGARRRQRLGVGSREAARPLYRIHFDFNKATLRPDSEPALEEIAGLLKSNPSLSIEVQGHTHAFGGDASNQKLSEARAASVREWLTAHGTAATHITSYGYGKTHPVASNDNDEGRARSGAWRSQRWGVRGRIQPGPT
ncbi:MAG TPA: OmpA family protein [Thermoanaerobaculia bacterium]|jgi:outer membrane protein OmpA-like peptidoglycan-associated protein|nr:OmpA family protein [Thermoanaerobaculia bacterium]